MANVGAEAESFCGAVARAIRIGVSSWGPFSAFMDVAPHRQDDPQDSVLTLSTEARPIETVSPSPMRET